MSAPGVTDLSELLRSMQPNLDTQTTYIYSTISFSSPHQTTLPYISADLPIEALIREAEGWTLITPSSSLKSHADFFIQHDQAADLHISTERPQARWLFEYSKITLLVQSSLEAVGLTGAICAALTPVGVSCNVVAGFYQDHIFVQRGDEEKAMAALGKLIREAGGEVGEGDLGRGS